MKKIKITNAHCATQSAFYAIRRRLLDTGAAYYKIHGLRPDMRLLDVPAKHAEPLARGLGKDYEMSLSIQRVLWGRVSTATVQWAFFVAVQRVLCFRCASPSLCFLGRHDALPFNERCFWLSCGSPFPLQMARRIPNFGRCRPEKSPRPYRPAGQCRRLHRKIMPTFTDLDVNATRQTLQHAFDFAQAQIKHLLQTYPADYYPMYTVNGKFGQGHQTLDALVRRVLSRHDVCFCRSDGRFILAWTRPFPIPRPLKTGNTTAPSTIWASCSFPPTFGGANWGGLPNALTRFLFRPEKQWRCAFRSGANTCARSWNRRVCSLTL